MKTNRLSHTQSSLFQECPQKYAYQYIENIRPETIGGALVFGSAIDKALEALVQGGDYKTVFLGTFSEQTINGAVQEVPSNPYIVYANSDYDPELIFEEDLEYLSQVLNGRYFKDVAYEIYEKKDTVGFENLSLQDRSYLNIIVWHCLKNKGLMVLEEAKNDVLPKFKKIIQTQVPVNLTNGEGDSIMGFADLVAEWEGVNKPIVFDFKTTSKVYDQDSVLTSPQLALYVHDLSDKYDNTRYAGFIVFNKNLEKKRFKKCSKCGKDGTGQRHKTCDNVINNSRCNGEWDEKVEFKVPTQVLINEIPSHTEDIVLQNFEYINQSIKNGIFHRNFSACTKQYGKMFIKCPYFDKCYKNSDRGLIRVKR